MSYKSDVRVHLDHLIPRQSIRYLPPKNINPSLNSSHTSFEKKGDNSLRYSDILQKEGWFTQIHKPDFQRESNAWTPEDCVDFLDSVVQGRIIPSIILWYSQENRLTYVLDGAHRLSVIRAWMMNDWGDGAGDYYERRDQAEINRAARQTRDLLEVRGIGHFSEYARAHREFMNLAKQGKIQKEEMGDREFAKAEFYGLVIDIQSTLAVQWERGNYESAEQSFLRINRSGQALEDWEASLIEYRRGSYARSIMCIANGGEAGQYWPDPQVGDGGDHTLINLVQGFGENAAGIYKRLFVPPFSVPVTSENVPFMVAPKYFQKHKYLLEIIPLLIDRKIATTEEQQIRIMASDVNADAATIIKNADRILTSLEEKLEHFNSPTGNSKSLSIVPLFYWYNQKADYARGLLYGFAYWFLAGTDRDILNRKLVFSGNRDRFEYLLFEHKRDIATLQERGGAGLHATKRAAEFFDETLQLLHQHPHLEKDSEELKEKITTVLRERARVTNQPKKGKKSRFHSKKDRSQINVRELFHAAIRCHICGGILSLQQGLHYDHVEDYALTKLTDPETGKPTHPFCNNHKKSITAYREQKKQLELPLFTPTLESISSSQYSFDFWGDDNFPA